MKTLWDRLREIDWATIPTAYGPAGSVPDQLEALRSGSNQEQIRAASQLSDALCHQGYSISIGALHALPYLLDVLEDVCAGAQEEILQMFVGMLRCSGPDSIEEWLRDVHEQLELACPTIEKILTVRDQEAREWAEELVRLLKTDYWKREW